MEDIKEDPLRESQDSKSISSCRSRTSSPEGSKKGSKEHVEKVREDDDKSISSCRSRTSSPDLDSRKASKKSTKTVSQGEVVAKVIECTSLLVELMLATPAQKEAERKFSLRSLVDSRDEDKFGEKHLEVLRSVVHSCSNNPATLNTLKTMSNNRRGSCGSINEDSEWTSEDHDDPQTKLVADRPVGLKFASFAQASPGPMGQMGMCKQASLQLPQRQTPQKMGGPKKNLASSAQRASVLQKNFQVPLLGMSKIKSNAAKGTNGDDFFASMVSPPLKIVEEVAIKTPSKRNASILPAPSTNNDDNLNGKMTTDDDHQPIKRSESFDRRQALGGGRVSVMGPVNSLVRQVDAEVLKATLGHAEANMQVSGTHSMGVKGLEQEFTWGQMRSLTRSFDQPEDNGGSQRSIAAGTMSWSFQEDEATQKMRWAWMKGSWKMFSFVLRLLGFIPWGIDTMCSSFLSVVFSAFIGFIVLLNLGYQFMWHFLEMKDMVTSQHTPAFRIAHMILALCALAAWYKLRELFSSPLFTTYVEHAYDEGFEDMWASDCRKFLGIQLLLALVSVGVRTFANGTFANADACWACDDGGAASIGVVLQMVGDLFAMVVIALTNVVLLTLFKFAQIAVFVLTSEIMQSRDLGTVCSTWSVYIVFTRSLSQSCSKLFVFVTSTAVSIGALAIYALLTGDDSSNLHFASLGIIVFACVMPLISAADIRENALQAITLINMIDFTDGQHEIDSDKAVCIQYLQASDCGFRVANQPVSMKLAMKVGYLCMACVVTVSLKLSSS